MPVSRLAQLKVHPGTANHVAHRHVQIVACRHRSHPVQVGGAGNGGALVQPNKPDPHLTGAFENRYGSAQGALPPGMAAAVPACRHPDGTYLEAVLRPPPSSVSCERPSHTGAESHDLVPLRHHARCLHTR